MGIRRGGRTLLVDALENLAKANPNETLTVVRRDGTTNPLDGSETLSTLTDEDVQTPLLLDFAESKSGSGTVYSRVRIAQSGRFF